MTLLLSNEVARRLAGPRPLAETLAEMKGSEDVTDSVGSSEFMSESI